MIRYKIRGIDTQDFGLIVSEGVGLLDPLTPKRNRRAQLDGYIHGEVINRAKILFESRKITLKCALVGDGATQFSERAAALNELFYGRNIGTTFRLEVVTPANHPLEFEVYCSKIGTFSNVKWRNGVMAANVTIELIEPEPVKRVYKINDKATKVQVKNPLGKQLNIYKSKRDVAGNPRVLLDGRNKIIDIPYGFDAKGDYMIITGDLNGEDQLSVTNATLIWRT